MSRISWGKPRIFVKDNDDSNSNWTELITPVESSTTLTVTKGDKLEAKIEGGENEDVKYKRSTYQTAFNIRKGKLPNGNLRAKPFPSIDGRVDHHYGLLLQPEDPTCEGFLIEDNTVTVDDTFDTTDGAMWQILMDALRAAEGDTVKWGLVTLSGSAGSRKISFTEGSSFDSGITGEGTAAKTITNADVVEVASTAVTS